MQNPAEVNLFIGQSCPHILLVAQPTDDSENFIGSPQMILKILLVTDDSENFIRSPQMILKARISNIYAQARQNLCRGHGPAYKYVLWYTLYRVIYSDFQ